MKAKRCLGVLLAAVMALAVMPTALATGSQPDTITLPNGEVREIPTIEVQSMSNSINSTSEDVVEITDASQLASLSQSEALAGKTFKIVRDLDFTGLSVSEWSGYILYFCGKLIGDKGNGEAPVIRGIPNNTSLIYGIAGGTIENLIFEHKGYEASFITFMPVNYSAAYTTKLTLNKITITGSIQLSGTDQSNYSPFVYCAAPGGIEMNNCINDADITGTVYGGVFHGYYPLINSEYTFKECVNKGAVTLQYAGMFFGNSTNMEDKLGSIQLTIDSCKNEGIIVGSVGANYLSAPVGGQYTSGSRMKTVENVLDGTQASSTDYPNVKPVDKSSGTLGPLAPLAGFSAEIDSDGSIIVTRATNETSENIDRYVVSVSAYVNLWYSAKGTFYGTDRCTVNETIHVSNLESGTTTFVPELMAYGFADMNYGTAGEETAGYETRYSDGSGTFYTVDNTVVYDVLFNRYVSKELQGGSPVGGGTVAPSFITVAAYNTGNELVGFLNLG